MKKCLTVIASLIAMTLVPGLIHAQSTLQLEFSTYLGGNSVDSGNGIALDSSNNIYLAGNTYSDNFPTVNPYQSYINNGASSDAFIAKLSSTGSALIYSTFLGGDGYDTANAIAVNVQDKACLAGKTYSADFPAKDAWQGTLNGSSDAFITLLSSSGSTLSFSSYIGGGDNDTALGIAINDSGHIYICGSTDSEDFPTIDCFQSSYGGGLLDGFITRFSASGSALYYSSYLGGSGNDDQVRAIAVDEDFYAYVTGQTDSDDFPTVWPYQSSRNGGHEAFVSKLAANGTSLVFSSYLGGSDGTDVGYGIALDDYRLAYLAGYTTSEDFPTLNAYQNTLAGGSDAFVANFTASGSALYYSTYIGGSGNDYANSISVEPFYGDSYITGVTKSTDFPTYKAYQAACAGGTNYGDVFLVNLATNGDQLHGSTYLGGPDDEEGLAVVMDSNNRAYLTGWAGADFPLRDPYQPSLGGAVDVFISTFYWGTPPAENRYHTDFNGDGTSDIAIFRSASGLWAVREITRAYFGANGDFPEPADYNGDGTTDLGVFRDSSGLWAIRGITRVYFGGGYDLPIPGDYNGDGTAVPGIFRASSGLWAIRGITRVYFGGTGDTASPGYYNSDDSLDIGIFRSNPGLWAIRGITRVYFGGSADTAKPGDYNGDGAWEPAVFRASSGLWAVRGITRAYFGSSIDEAIPADYNGDNSDTPGIFRSTSGLWAARGTTRIYFGGVGDIPVTR